MRYALLLVAYMLVAFIVGIGYLFPNRPASLFEFFVVAAVLIPVVAAFDFIGQKTIESHLFNTSHQIIRWIIAIVILTLFLFTVSFAVNLIGLTLTPW